MRPTGRGAAAEAAVGRSWLQYWAVYSLSRLLLWPIPLAYLLQVRQRAKGLETDTRPRNVCM